MNAPTRTAAAPPPAPVRMGRALWISAATMASRVLGLVRDQLFAALVGANAFSDAYVAAFRIPNLLRDLFAEGALGMALLDPSGFGKIDSFFEEIADSR